MRPSAAEALKAAIRRSLPLTVALVILGALTVFTLRQLQGPQYSASARVVHNSTDLGAILTGTQPSYIDPRRVIDTALALARSPELYDRTAVRLGLPRSDGEGIQTATKVSGGDATDVIVFTATKSTPEAAIRTVNAVSAEYIRWRTEIAGEAVRRAITQIRTQLPSTTGRPRAALEEQLNRLNVLNTLNSGGATRIEQATEAPKVSPRPVRDAMFGGALGLVVALMFAGAREAFNTRVRSEADVEEALDRPVLASIQTLPKRTSLVTVGRHESRFGDTYALLAANLMQIRADAGPMVLAVTSAIASEGKTTTAANLAMAMAQRGRRVILADFDLRKPSVARVFRIPADAPGVLQLIDGNVALPGAMWTISLNGAGPGHASPVSTQSGNGGIAVADSGTETHGELRIIPSGGSERGARVARAAQTPQLLSELLADTDIVILDTPPALATVEMAELSTIVDMVLVVVRHGKVTRRSLLALNRQSQGWQAEIVGAVITDAPAEEDDYYYYR
ncbi:MAG TPA: P-loop NTPase [Gaiellaceae bacterium]|nr:P-loop NTPase [Gaiellaceae bacterium]